MDGSRILIFMDTKKGCDQVTRQLRMDGWPALSVHGDKSQAERDWVLSEFKAGKSPIMTATDVAARGLDVKDVKYVINYDFPGSLEIMFIVSVEQEGLVPKERHTLFSRLQMPDLPRNSLASSRRLDRRLVQSLQPWDVVHHLLQVTEVSEIVGEV